MADFYSVAQQEDSLLNELAASYGRYVQVAPQLREMLQDMSPVQ